MAREEATRGLQLFLKTDPCNFSNKKGGSKMLS